MDTGVGHRVALGVWLGSKAQEDRGPLVATIRGHGHLWQRPPRNTKKHHSIDLTCYISHQGDKLYALTVHHLHVLHPIRKFRNNLPILPLELLPTSPAFPDPNLGTRPNYPTARRGRPPSSAAFHGCPTRRSQPPRTASRARASRQGDRSARFDSKKGVNLCQHVMISGSIYMYLLQYIKRNSKVHVWRFEPWLWGCAVAKILEVVKEILKTVPISNGPFPKSTKKGMMGG